MNVVRRRDLWPLLTAAPILAQVQKDKEEIWRQYIEWSTGRRTLQSPRDDYREKLMSEGMSIYEADRRVHMIEQRLSGRPDAWMQWFNRAYERDQPAIAVEPNRFLVESVNGLAPGRALDIAMGQGRNGVFLAKLGWQVTGFDVSDVGLAAAQANARRNGVSIETVLASHGSFYYGHDVWDLVFMLYAFAAMNERLAERIISSLKPGGLMLYEHLLNVDENAEWTALGAAGPRPGELRRWFGSLAILRDEEVRDIPDWGPPQPAPIQRFLARKP